MLNWRYYNSIILIPGYKVQSFFYSLAENRRPQEAMRFEGLSLSSPLSVAWLWSMTVFWLTASRPEPQPRPVVKTSASHQQLDGGRQQTAV